MKRFFFSFSVLLLSAGATFAQAGDTPADTQPSGQPASQPTAPHKVDKAAAYYHYSLAHMYEEQVAVYGRSEMAGKAIDDVGDKTLAPPERQRRKRRLIQGPQEFREMPRK